MNVCIIDYGSGNLHSVHKACEHVASNGQAIQLTSDPEHVKHAGHIVLPGVGAFADCVSGLRAIDGMVGALEEAVLHKKTPFLGICVGMQMLFETGHEHGEHQGLGWLKGHVRPLKNMIPEAMRRDLAIPHMGWNSLTLTNTTHPMAHAIPRDQDVYFVHSYAALAQSDGAYPEDTLATVEYGASVCAMVAKNNIIGTQFHPEKSQAAGLAMLRFFLGRTSWS